MKLAKLIYNPFSGSATFKKQHDTVFRILQEYGWQVVPYRTKSIADIYQGLKDLEQHDYQAVFAAGGDGTIHHVINGLLKSSKTCPLGIFPVGTANDLASHLQLPNDIEQCCHIIGEDKLTKLDMGLVNGRYFHNVAAGGMLTDISYQINTGLKNTFGKMAYYVKGFKELGQIEPFKLELSYEDKTLAIEVVLFLILNGKHAGGFNVSPKASLTDGKFDVILIRNCSMKELLAVFAKLLRGQHIKSPYVEYFQTNQLLLNCDTLISTDLDGERGPELPWELTVSSQKLSVFSPVGQA